MLTVKVSSSGGSFPGTRRPWTFQHMNHLKDIFSMNSNNETMPETMGDDNSHNFPSQKEIEKDISDYLTKKYGERIKIIGIHAQSETAKQPPAIPGDAGLEQFHFDIKPEELYAFLDEYVIRQDAAKAVLATKICTHFNRIRLALAHPRQSRLAVGQIKNNVLLIGPTGVGKTYLVKLIAKKLGVPFVKGDATKFSETGYVGGDVEDLVRDLVREADENIERAQYGIIYIDEIDKIASSSNRIGPDVSRGGVQRALLKPMEETEVDLKVPHDPISQMEAIEQYRATGKRQRKIINTKDILFIMSGAFNGLEDIIKKRIQKQAIGFEGTIRSKKDTGQLLKKVKAEDLIEYGFESEFIGRLPVIACLDTLTVKDLHEILLNFNCSVVVGKKLDFKAYDIHIQFEDEALLEIAKLAYKEQTGARGLVSIMEKILLPFEKKLPSTNIRYLAVTSQLVQDPNRELAKLVNDPQQRTFHEQHYRFLAQQERERLIDFILTTKKKYLEAHDVIPTPTRLALISQRCQEEVLDITEMLAIFTENINQIRQCAQDISAKCAIRVIFSDEAIDWMLSQHPLTGDMIKAQCQNLLQTFEYGFGLLKQKKGVEEIIIPAEGLKSPEKYINELVATSFREEGKVNTEV